MDKNLCSLPRERAQEVRIGNGIIMPVQRENYVKSSLRKERCCTEMRTHIEITNETLQMLKNILRETKISLEIKENGAELLFHINLLHGCVCWTISSQMKRSLEVTDAIFFRRMLGIL